jgi:hypothetical protein
LGTFLANVIGGFERGGLIFLTVKLGFDRDLVIVLALLAFYP